MQVHFLSAAVPLTKTFTPREKRPYPLVKHFTSHDEPVETIQDLFRAIEGHAKLGHCLLKGPLRRALAHEPRVGATRTDDASAWVCLDFDRHAATDLDAVLQQLGLGDISYVRQDSASHGLPGTEGTISAHVFMLLEAPVGAPDLKRWLMDLNLTHLRGGLRLTRCKNALSWPLDISTCQNDKLLYIAPPKFVAPLTDPLKTRITLVKKPRAQLPLERLEGRHLEALRKDARAALNVLREAEGLEPRRVRTTTIDKDGVEVIQRPDVAQVTEVKAGDEFVRLNVNGGDSFAYWHPKGNFEWLFDYKTGCKYKTQAFVPGYYADCLAEREVQAQTPSETGDLVLAFRDLKSAEYYNGLWNPITQGLELYRAKNETQLDHWMKSHGRTLGEYIPIWDIRYEPTEDWIVDEPQHRINTFRASPYMGLECEAPLSPADFPTIHGIVAHMLGADLDLPADCALVDHFYNWFACVFQRRHKPLTAWVMHGTEGTGKGYFFNKIARPLLGQSNAMSVTISNIEDQFNGFLEGKLLVLLDEVDVDDFREKGRVTARLRGYITEPTMALRRMRTQAIDVPNHCSFIFSSNRPQPVSIPPGDRRYNVGNFQAAKLPRPVDADVRDELERFAAWLQAHPADPLAANTVLDTEARQRIKKLSSTSIDETCYAIKSGDFEFLWLARTDEALLRDVGVMNEHTANAQAYNLLMKRLAKDALVCPQQAITRDELNIILQYNVGGLPRTPNKFTSLLRHHGIETRQIRKHGAKTFGIDVEWRLDRAFRDELKKGLRP